MDKKIDDYNIEISGTENIKYIYFYRCPTGLHFSGEPVNNNFIQETISNISFFIGNKEYYLKFSDYEENLYEFYAIDVELARNCKFLVMPRLFYNLKEHYLFQMW